MGKFYRDTHAAAVAARTANETTRSTRAAAKPLSDAIQALITSIAAKGDFACLLVGVLELQNTDTVRLATALTDKLHVIEAPIELADAIVARLNKQFDFVVSFYAQGVTKLSWETPEIV